MSEIPLEKLIATICDPTDLTDAEVREELAEQGIDLDAAMARFRPKLDELMRARAVRLAIEALKTWPTPAPGDTLPWVASESPDFPEAADLVSANGGLVATLIWPVNAAHIAAAVNSAPVLAAEVKRLQDEVATLNGRPKAAKLDPEMQALFDSVIKRYGHDLDLLRQSELIDIARRSAEEVNIGATAAEWVWLHGIEARRANDAVAEVERLTTALAVARVAVQEVCNPVHSAVCRCGSASDPCICGAYDEAFAKLRRAVGLEEGK